MLASFQAGRSWGSGRRTLQPRRSNQPKDRVTIVQRLILGVVVLYIVSLITWFRSSPSSNQGDVSALDHKLPPKRPSKLSSLRAKSTTAARRLDTCQFRQYPPRRYYGLAQPSQPDFLTQAEYIYGQLPTILPTQADPARKLCVDQSEWFEATTSLPFADGTNPSLLQLRNSRLEGSIAAEFPEEARYLATICMTNSQCAWKDSPQEIQDYKLSEQTEPSTVRTVLLVLNQNFETIQEATMVMAIDAKFGNKRNAVQPQGQTKTFALDDARLFTHQGQLWISYREGPRYGYDKQILNRVHLEHHNERLTATLKASEVETLCCGRNMALLDNVQTGSLQALTWVDPITVVDVELKKSQRQRLQSRERPSALFPRRQLKDQPKKSDFHGTNGFMVHLPQTSEYLGIGHFHRPPGRQANDYARFGHHYTHAFFTIPDTPPFHLKRLSAELLLPSQHDRGDAEIIQFWSGLELVDGDTLALAYGINDCEGAATYVSLSTVDSLLQNVPEKMEVVDLMKPFTSTTK